ncbi:DUF5681 domain-containing protein [Bradyrhizobium sp. JYMT SZCCT0428]|uniref:DUF5681 domain-containing protein n=1 Tax=Bradyrhizobium sp. JYMT SZCCT0428 TaxID=2807673 RepID=UPI00289E001F|nr:DUF5681 domain-containing protein [Bradyrhizobium sp. JYMT SZCCT0428]
MIHEAGHKAEKTKASLGSAGSLFGALMPSPEITGRKQADTRFKPGKSGNPDGRPKGSRNATTLALETLLMGKQRR